MSPRRPCRPLLAAVALLVAACGEAGSARSERGASGHTASGRTGSSPSAAPVGNLVFGPPASVAPGTDLAAVSCLSPTDCVALDTAGQAWAFDGHAWRGPLTVPALTAGAGGRPSVSCAAGACVADPDGGDQVATWDGTAWSVPTTITGATALEAVGCAPTGYCAAVDALGDAFASRGQGWAATSGDWGSVTALSCTSATFCMSALAGGLSQWDGRQWTQPDPQGATGPLTGVSCPSAAFCAAVDGTGQVLQWAGSSWSAPTTVEPVAGTPGTLGPAPTAVSCPTASTCVAVDDAGRALQWHGSTWSTTDVDGDRDLTAVSCPTAATCVAVDSTGHAVVGRA